MTEQLGIVTSIKNATGVDIPKGWFVNVNGSTFSSEEDYNKKLGVAIADTQDGEMIPVAISGIVLCATGSAITKGNKVYCDGKIYAVNFSDPVEAPELQKVVGTALDSSNGADQLIRVLLT